MTKLEFDPSTQKIVDDFDAHAKKRAAELLASTPNEPLQVTRETAFCLGYKAGVIDLGASLREQPVVDVARLAAVFEAACTWRDAWSEMKAVYAQDLIDAIDTARKASP